MISKERLVELIKEEATIYQICYGDVIKRELRKECVLKENNYITCTCKKCIEAFGEKGNDCLFIFDNNCSETYEEAYHQANFVDMEMVEKLSLLNYSELLKEKETSDYYSIRFAKSRTELDEQYLFYISFKSKYITVERSIDDNINKALFDKPLTEANYLEACELCKKLFIGEEV